MMLKVTIQLNSIFMLFYKINKSLLFQSFLTIKPKNYLKNYQKYFILSRLFSER